MDHHPWTLPSNLALIVSPMLAYCKVRTTDGKQYILQRARLCELFPAKKKKGSKQKAAKGAAVEEAKADDYPAYNTTACELVDYPGCGEDKTFPGALLTGVEYVPLFPYFAAHAAHGAFKVLVDDYVTDASGTGIVHAAPASVRTIGACAPPTAS